MSDSASNKRARTEEAGSEEAKVDAGCKWVLPVDGSRHNKKAFEWLARNMNKSDKVYVITIVEEVHPHLPNTPYFAKMKEEMNATLHEKAKAHLKEFANMCIERQLKHECYSITADSAKQAICEYVAEIEADNLVMGRRGLSDNEKLILGSTSDYCIKHAYASVTIVK